MLYYILNMNRRKFLYSSTTIVIGAGILQSYSSKPALGATFSITDSVNIPEDITNPEININVDNIELRAKNINEEFNATIVLKARLKNESTLESVDSTSIEITESTGKTYIEDILLNISTENSGLDINDELEDKNEGDSLEIVLKLDIEHPSTETISTDKKNINLDIVDEEEDEETDDGDKTTDDAILLPKPDDIDNHFEGAKDAWDIKESGDIEPIKTDYYLTNIKSQAGKITSNEGLGEYPKRGDAFTGYFKESSGDNNPFHYFLFGVQNDDNKYGVHLTTKQTPFIFKDDFSKLESGEIDDAPPDTWYEWEIQWLDNEDGTIIYKIYSLDQDTAERNEELVSISMDDIEYNEGAIAIYSEGEGDAYHSKWNVIEDE